MPKELHLLTPLSTFEKMHKLADSRKAIVSLERDILTQLLIDHSLLVSACKAVGIRVIEPAAKRRRPQLKA